jgi:hypothetical protein
MTHPFDCKIAIIGCGPSGIFTAYFLNKLGYANLHLYGDINEAQPRTVMVDDIVNDVATSYCHNGYRNSIGKLIEEYGFTKSYISGSSHNQTIENQKLGDFKSDSDNDYLNMIKLMAHAVVWKCAKDLPIANEIYGVSMQEYKDRYITKDTLFWLDSGGSAQGYGFLDEVASYHLFRWLRPSIFLTGETGVSSHAYMIQEGFGSLFKKVNDSLLTTRKINKLVTKVSKNQITTKDNKAEHYDRIFVCCTLSSIKTPLKINSNTHITYTKVFTYLFESKQQMRDLRHIAYCLDNIRDHKKTAILTLRSNNSTADGSVSHSGRHIYGCFGYCETLNETKVRSIIRKELEQYGFDIKTDHYFKIYKYNYRYTQQAIEEGIHYYVNEQQGKDGLYYLGGMLSHWDVDSIYEHSREIVNHFHLNVSSSPIEKFKTLANIQYNKWIDEW